MSWAAIIGAVGSLADDLITTDEERAKIALEDRRIDAQLLQGQIETNKAEAAHPSLFVAGWRPYAGWVAATALGMVYIPKAAVMTAIWSYQCWVVLRGWQPPAAAPQIPLFPDLGVTDLIGLLMALLGMAGIRSFDKARGKDTVKVGS